MALQAPPPLLEDAIQQADQLYHLPDDLLEGIWRIESGSHFPNPYVNSSGYGGLFGTRNWNASTQDQAKTAAQILANLLHTDGGNIEKALSSYSGGGYTSVPGERTFGTWDPGAVAAAGLGDSGTQTQQSSGTANPAGAQTGATQDASLTSAVGGALGAVTGGVEGLLIRGLEIMFGAGLVMLGVAGIYAALVKGSSDPAALLALAKGAVPSATGGGGSGDSGGGGVSRPSPEEHAAVRAARERRSEEAHQARVKLTQARATEVRTRQRHRKQIAAGTKKQVESRERTAYTRGAEDVLKTQASRQGARRT